ncbi:MAG TPA: ABC transporter ATP-binding protein [Dehalococcoidia bacterium]|nr:ABC transporter ATP-binding protein [Dehalococcoidia bacterium]
MTPIIAAEDLVKRYKAITAVDHVSFSIGAQEAFGLLGPNGAGKTTVMRMVYCASPPMEGRLFVDGMDVRTQQRRIKAVLGVVPQEDNLDPDLTVMENLLVYARYFDLPKSLALERARQSLELFQLLDRRDSPIHALSGGMKRRLVIARALINQPKILILDEPTTGLDPQAKHLVWQRLHLLKSRGVTVVISTHNMEEAARLCDRLVIMHLGRVLVEGSPQELVQRHVDPEVLEVRPSEEEKPKLLARLGQRGIVAEDVAGTLYVYSRNGDALRRELNLGFDGVVHRGATLEDVFLRLTGRALVE